MITLGIDPGTLITGFGLIEHTSANQMRAVDFGVIRTNPKDTMPERLKMIHDEIEKVIVRYKPQHLSLETAFFNKNVQAALKLGQVRGMVMVLGLRYTMRVSEYSPREVKKSVTGNGAAAKEQVAFMMKKMLTLSETGKFLDATDALALALCDIFASPKSPVAPPTSELSKSLQPKASGKKTWKQFLSENPQLVIK
jgi:crossover junction endodeoxyribonuclease RuvC